MRVEISASLRGIGVVSDVMAVMFLFRSLSVGFGFLGCVKLPHLSGQPAGILNLMMSSHF